MAVPLASGARDIRQAAIALFALPNADREWLMDRLASSSRARLAAMIAELGELGLPVDPRAVRSLLVVGDIPEAPAFGSPDPNVIEDQQGRNIRALATADGRAVARCIGSMPPMLLARLLLIWDWTWTADFRRQLDPQYLRVVDACQEQARLHRQQGGGMLDDALVRHVLRIVEQTKLVRPGNVVPPGRIPRSVFSRTALRWFGVRLNAIREEVVRSWR